MLKYDKQQIYIISTSLSPQKPFIFMKKNTFILLWSCLLMLCKHATAQLHLNVFSYSEFFYTPNANHSKQKIFHPTNIGLSIAYDFNRQWSLALGAQHVQRRFDWDCVRIGYGRTWFFIFNPDTCQYKLQVVSNEIQFPVSIIYSFRSSKEQLTHSIGIGNTIFYYFKSNLFISNDTISYSVPESASAFIYRFAPELFYQLDAKLYKNVSLNAIIGVRKQGFNGSNYAIFGKLGLGYPFHWTQKAKKKGRKR
jgi:hypothetical protein